MAPLYWFGPRFLLALAASDPFEHTLNINGRITILSPKLGKRPPDEKGRKLKRHGVLSLDRPEVVALDTHRSTPEAVGCFV